MTFIRGSRTARAAAILIVSGVVLIACVEGFTRIFIHDMSNMLGRLKRESTTAAQLRATPERPRPVLVVGNSLLVAAVDVPLLDQQLRPDGRSAFRFAIEQTVFFDWYYGMRRLMRSGARPDVIVLCYEVRHLLSDGYHSEIFGHYLLDINDLPDAFVNMRLHPAEGGELFFANISDFWGLRKEIRKNLLARMMPQLPSLTSMMARTQPAPPADLGLLKTVGAQRLKAMHDELAGHGVKFVLAVAPPVSVAEANAIREAASSVGVTVVVPLLTDEITPDDYDGDKYHLGGKGRVKYTEALARSLRATLSERARSEDPR